MEQTKIDLETMSINRLAKFNIDSPFLSSRFKIWVVGVVFFLVFFHLFSVCAFPQHTIIPKEVILGVVLALIAYLWSQEVRDRDRLRAFNEDLIRFQQKLEEAEISTMASLIRVEEAKDTMIRGHSQRVAKFAVAMAEAKEYSADTKEMIYRSAILHDLGKLAIPDNILQKPGKLTDEEWELIRKHPQMGVDILAPLKFLSLEKKIILHHHERIDGKGYPLGLKAAEIPLESKVVAIADTFDAMNSSRLYRAPCTKEYILAELQRVAGSQLDSSLVVLFLKLLDRHPEFWDRT